MGFGSSGYTYMPQQMSAQSGVNMNQYTTAGPTYPNGSYASSHHHQVALQVFSTLFVEVYYKMFKLSACNIMK